MVSMQENEDKHLFSAARPVWQRVPRLNHIYTFIHLVYSSRSPACILSSMIFPAVRWL
jgi:hypothetical protein